MDTEKLKNRVREALGAAGIPHDVADHVERIIEDTIGGGKNEVSRRQHDDDDDDRKHRVAKAAETRAKPAARKIAVPRKKK